MSEPHGIEFAGVENNRIAASLWDGRGHPVLFFHGGGQTRRAWDLTARRVAMEGMRAITVDLRGHGESAWVESGNYRFSDFAADVAAIIRQTAERFHAAPSAVGASLGGLSSLAAETQSGPLLESLVLVDITPRMDPDGVAKIQGFMAERMDEGFATLEEAADAVASYLPHRPRPPSLEGLRKNLRLCDDGRFRWHWDPAFMRGDNNINSNAREFAEGLMGGIPDLHLPVLLVRGMNSELVQEDFVREFVDLAPNASSVDVSGAGHMVAGDKNDLFCDAVLDFLTDREAA
ncbi:alpha/beta hydrolase [Nitratireductor mangrovi]|uniref:Alpha/beta hydrolase n=1 Tax=Nitratireductor mangrovi TaxID=2599600 RepID=A0A5B8KVC1_9HYPH|nr:alpha/beta hydrolase [Nitratireductor mangrovi]QDY99527.1 alpha/beta hydrolase [Nitratireductor mangrovi]